MNNEHPQTHIGGVSGGWGDVGVIYQPIPSEPGYWAGNDGSVWSFNNQAGHKSKRLPLRRKPGLTGRKRNRPNISFARPGYKMQTRQLPHLILEAFVGPKPPGLECCHYDDDPPNNRLGNLRWDTHESNMEDARRNRRERTAKPPKKLPAPRKPGPKPKAAG